MHANLLVPATASPFPLPSNPLPSTRCWSQHIYVPKTMAHEWNWNWQSHVARWSPEISNCQRVARHWNAPSRSLRPITLSLLHIYSTGDTNQWAWRYVFMTWNRIGRFIFITIIVINIISVCTKQLTSLHLYSFLFSSLFPGGVELWIGKLNKPSAKKMPKDKQSKASLKLTMLRWERVMHIWLKPETVARF